MDEAEAGEHRARCAHADGIDEVLAKQAERDDANRDTPPGADGELLPLLVMNPMGKDHVAALLDALLALDADGVAADVVAEAAAELGDVPGDFRAALIVADDARGGWTNRYASEFSLRFETHPQGKRFWITAVLWSSEPATEETVRRTMLAAVHRTAYQIRHGPTRTLRDRRPELPVILATGYSSYASEVVAEGFALIEKPYRRDVLAASLRSAVEGRGASA